MLIPLLLAALTADAGHAHLHPAGADLFLEVPDARAAFAAYAQAPALKMVNSDAAGRIAAFAKELGWDLGAIVGGVLPVADPARPNDRWWPWSACTHASASFSGIEGAPATGATPAAMSAWMVLDFADAQAATQAEKALVAMGGAEPKPSGELTIGASKAEVVTIGSPLEALLPEPWIARIDARLVLGAGAAKPADFATRVADPRGGMAPARAACDTAKAFSAPSGATVLEILSDMDDLPAFAQGSATGGALAGTALFFGAPFISARGAWRVQLRGDRFVTEGLYEPRGLAARTLSAFGGATLPANAARYVPPDAVGTWVTSVDAARAESAIADLLLSVARDDGKPIEPPPQGSPRMADGLGAAMAMSLLPFQGLMSPTPRIVLAIELKDAAKFQAGLDAWIARAQKAMPELQVERKPYRKVNTIILGLGADKEGGGEEPASSGPQLGPFGAASLEPTRPAIAVLEDRVVFASAPSVVRGEIKRAQEKDAGPPHAITQQTGRPTEAFEASSMDWVGFLSKLYDAVRGFAPMLAQNLGKPVDVEKLPTSAELFAGFRPTSSWSRRVDGRVLSYSESSFGPETPLGLVGVGALAFRSMRSGVGAGAVQSTPPSPAEPSPGAAASGGEEARQTTLDALREVRTAIAVYRSQAGRAPATLATLLEKTDAFPDGFLAGGKVPTDGWGRALIYDPAADGATYALRSCGPDGIDQKGQGDDVRLP
jgi:hypothetical protein